MCVSRIPLWTLLFCAVPDCVPSMLQERARALSDLRRLEADIGEAMRNLKGAQGEEEALGNKAMHLRDEIDRAELARDKALVAHNKAQAVSPSAALGLFQRQLKLHRPACRQISANRA